MRRLVDAMMATKVVTTSIKRKFLPAVPHRSGEIMTMIMIMIMTMIMTMIMLMMIMSRSGGSSGPPSRVVSVTSSQVRASLRSQEAAVYTTQLSTTSNTSTLSGNSNSNNTSSNRSGNRRTVPRLETQDSFDSWSIPVLSKEEASRILSSKRPRVIIETFNERSIRIIFVYLPVLAAAEAS